MWPVAKSGEPEAKRMRRAVAFGEEENPLSRGPSGPLRSSKSGENGSTPVETNGHLWVRALKRGPGSRSWFLSLVGAAVSLYWQRVRSGMI